MFKGRGNKLRLEEQIIMIAMYAIDQKYIDGATEIGTIFWTAEQFAALEKAPSLEYIGEGNQIIVSKDELEGDATSGWKIAAPPVAAKDLTDTSYYWLGYIKHADGTVSYSGIVTYTFEQYMYEQRNSSDANLLELVKCLYVYEKAAYAALR